MCTVMSVCGDLRCLNALCTLHQCVCVGGGWVDVWVGGWDVCVCVEVECGVVVCLSMCGVYGVVCLSVCGGVCMCV